MNRNRRYNKNLIRKPVEPEDSSKERIENKIFEDENITNPEFIDRSVKSTIDSSRITYVHHLPKNPNNEEVKEVKEEVKEEIKKRIIAASKNLRKDGFVLPLKQLRLKQTRGVLPTINNMVSNYNYSTSTSYLSLGTNITTLTKGITEGINLKFPTVTLTLLDDVSYVETTNYARGSNGATLLPLDVVNLHSGCIDIGLYCVEIYKKRSTTFNDLVRVDACEIKAAGKTLGGDYYTPGSGTENKDEFDENVEMMSIAKDTCGNCYVIKKDIVLDDVEDYLTVTDGKFNKIDPTNQSKWYGYNSQNNSSWQMKLSPTFESRLGSDESGTSTRVIPNNTGTSLCAFECYVRGFLFMNQNSKTTGGDIDNDAPHANFIWIDAPILFSITKGSDNKYQIKIGDLIDTEPVAYDPVSDTKVLFTAKLNNPISDDIVGNNVKLPINSGFFTSNFIKTENKKFEGVKITISSLSNYWQ